MALHLFLLTTYRYSFYKKGVVNVNQSATSGLVLHYPVSALLHEPFRRGGGTADAYRLHTLEPSGVYLLGTLYKVAVGVYLLTAREESMAVAALATTDKEDVVVVGG